MLDYLKQVFGRFYYYSDPSCALKITSYQKIYWICSRRETNRLRAVKDEAKRLVVQNFPHLFRDSNINSNSQDLSGGNLQD